MYERCLKTPSVLPYPPACGLEEDVQGGATSSIEWGLLAWKQPLAHEPLFGLLPGDRGI